MSVVKKYTSEHTEHLMFCLGYYLVKTKHKMLFLADFILETIKSLVLMWFISLGIGAVIFFIVMIFKEFSLLMQITTIIMIFILFMLVFTLIIQSITIKK